jgi:2-methylisocitrate lyase-like PEP mutase family enzyme
MRSSDGANKLRRLLAAPGSIVLPSCHDALSACLIRDAGFHTCFVSGYGVAATLLGMPDMGLTTQTEMAECVRRICAAVPELPVIADGDTGYGNALNVRRTVIEYARAGAAGILIEDQVNPKRCGYFAGKEVVGLEDACTRVKAALDARNDSGHDILIIARTDASTVLGFGEAMQRVLRFQELGADALFIERLQNEAELREFCAGVERPTWYNNLTWGGSPYLARDTLQEIGFKLISEPTMLFSATHAMRMHLEALRSGTHPPPFPPRLDFEAMKGVLGLGAFAELEKRYIVK